MLQKCRIHFELARRLEESPKDVVWLSEYFLAKIAEKLGNSPEKAKNIYFCFLSFFTNPKSKHRFQICIIGVHSHWKRKAFNIWQKSTKQNKSVWSAIGVFSSFLFQLWLFQTHFEPLEIHYKAHSYALRYMRGAPTLLANSSLSSLQYEKDLTIIHAYLTIFQQHGVQNRSSDGRWSVYS